MKEEVYEQITDLPGELIIKEYPTKSASPNDLKIHLEKLRKRDINVGHDYRRLWRFAENRT